MAKKKAKEWNINDEVCRAEYYECLKKCEITELVEEYLENFENLIRAMNTFMEQFPNGLIFFPDACNAFEGDLQRANFHISNKFLCEQIERYFHNHSFEHIKLLNNNIGNKIRRIEAIFEEFVSKSEYYKFKDSKIYFRESYIATMLICSDEFYSRCLSFYQSGGDIRDLESRYGTLETFYTETIKLFNIGKSRIMELFIQKELPKVEPEASEIDTNSNGKNTFLYPEIFKNIHAYNMFLELQKLTVKPNSVVADYSFIFHKMKHKDFRAINQTVTEPIFIRFLVETQNAEISVNKLPFKNPKYKQPIYTTTLDKYKGLINTEPQKVQL